LGDWVVTLDSEAGTGVDGGGVFAAEEDALLSVLS